MSTAAADAIADLQLADVTTVTAEGGGFHDGRESWGK